MKYERFCAVSGLAFTVLVIAPAAAQVFPSKVVRLVVPFAPGGSNDVVARGVSQPLSQALGQAVVVENRPGANTLIGTEYVARSPADGHTVLIAGFTFVANSALRSKPPYDALKDFSAVAGFGSQAFVLSVHPSLPAKSIKELVALARSRPGQLVYAINGYGTGQHLSGELLKLMARIDMKHVAFQGGGPATVAVLGGHASILFSTAPPIVQHVAPGRLRPLAVTSRERSTLLADVPTMMELGFADFDMSGAMGVFAPAATPKEAINRLGAEIVRVVQLPNVRDSMRRDGFAVQPTGPMEYAAAIESKFHQIQKIGRSANVKLD
jgi:tripartite-type tricarboxylate transporter receptor subunit TctC